MQRRPAQDPTSWIYQANMHGTYDTPPLPDWNQCQHGSFFFLSWHRMYVYYFERILRAASGDASLALPYWSYGEPTQRALPLVFRQPADGSNPLYTPNRNTGGPDVNQGALLPASAVSHALSFRFVNFYAPAAPRPNPNHSFGGQRVGEPGHYLSPHGELEHQPHDQVHDLVGGADGWMSDPNAAALDPIFWLHHANIDRLWKRWLDQGGGRADPADVGVWMTWPFTFFDERGQEVKMSGGDVLDTVGQLGYRYDDDPPPLPLPRYAGQVAPAVPVAAAATPDGQGQPPTGLGASEAAEMIELGGAPVTVPVTMQQPAHPALAQAADGDVVQQPLSLNVEGIHFQRNPGVTYEVYLNLPEGQEPDYQSVYYVGNLGFFALGGHAHGGAGDHGGPDQAADLVQQSFDITPNVRALQARGEWQGSPTEVTFVMRGLEPPAPSEAPGAAAQPPPAAQPGSPVHIQRVTITAG
jgi:tyrosinase